MKICKKILLIYNFFILTIIIISIFIFSELIVYMIFADVILSWLVLLWIKFRPKFIYWVLNPIYSNIKKYIPTSIWVIDFTPIVAIMIIILIQNLLLFIFPDIASQIKNISI